MKNFKQTKHIIGINFFLLLILVFSADLTAQKSSSIKIYKFQILVETNEESIKLTGQEGCSFKELTYNIGLNRPQAIDQDGMTTLEMTKQGETKQRMFLFTITKTDNGLNFEAFEGTSWKKLNFECPKNSCSQIIDENGMFNKMK